MKEFFKKHWKVLLGVAVVFLVYRSLTAKINRVAAESSNASTSPTAGSAQAPIIYPANALSAGGYDSSSGVSAGVSGGSGDATSAAMLSVLSKITDGNNATNLAAVTGSNANTAQATALNSSTSNTVGTAFSNLLSSFIGDKSNQLKTLNVGLNPTASGGVNFTAKQDINLDALPTLAQSANYAGNVVSMFTTPAPKVVNTAFSNFDAAAYERLYPDVNAPGAWRHPEKSRAQDLYEHWMVANASGDQRKFTAKTA